MQDDKAFSDEDLKRLRSRDDYSGCEAFCSDLRKKAADEIERLQTEKAELRALYGATIKQQDAEIERLRAKPKAILNKVNEIRKYEQQHEDDQYTVGLWAAASAIHTVLGGDELR